MFLARREVMDAFNPGDHGSTFRGNPISAAVGLEALNLLVEKNLIERSAEMGDYMLAAFGAIDSPAVVAMRGRGCSSAWRSTLISTPLPRGANACSATVFLPRKHAATRSASRRR